MYLRSLKVIRDNKIILSKKNKAKQINLKFLPDFFNGKMIEARD